MSTISPSESDARMTPELQAAFEAITDPNELRAYAQAVRDEIILQNGGRRDEMDPSIIHLPTVPTAPVGDYVKSVTVGGETFEFRAETEAQALEAMTAFVAAKAQASTVEEKPLELIYDPISRNYRDSKGRFVSDDVARNIIDRHEQEANEDYRAQALDAELRTKLLRGEISLREALAQVAPQVEATRLRQSWEESVQTFLSSDASVGWEGGEANVERIGKKIDELGLVDTPDKVAAIAQAFAALQQEDAEKADADAMVAYTEALNNARSTSEIAEIQARFFGNRSVHGMSPDELAARGFWGAR